MYFNSYTPTRKSQQFLRGEIKIGALIGNIAELAV